MSKLLIHHSPLGALEIPTVLGVVEPGDPFEVDDDIADSLLLQSDLYSLAPTPEKTVEELREIATDLGIEVTSKMRKRELIDAIANASPANPGPTGDDPTTTTPSGDFEGTPE